MAARNESVEVLALRPRPHAARHRSVAVRITKVLVDQRRVVVGDRAPQLVARLAARRAGLEHPDAAVQCRPRLLGPDDARDRWPVGIGDREHTARPQDPGDLGERRLGLHPVHRLHRQHDVGHTVAETGAVRDAGRYVTPDVWRDSAVVRMSSLGSIPITEPAQLAAHRDDNPVPLPRSTTVGRGTLA